MPWVTLTTTCVDGAISMVNSITKVSASTMICDKDTNLACIYLKPVSNTLLSIHRVHSPVKSSLRSSRERSNPQLETIPGSPSLLRVSKLPLHLPLLGLKLSTTTSSSKTPSQPYTNPRLRTLSNQFKVIRLLHLYAPCLSAFCSIVHLRLDLDLFQGPNI